MNRLVTLVGRSLVLLTVLVIGIAIGVAIRLPGFSVSSLPLYPGADAFIGNTMGAVLGALISIMVATHIQERKAVDARRDFLSPMLPKLKELLSETERAILEAKSSASSAAEIATTFDHLTDNLKRTKSQWARMLNAAPMIDGAIALTLAAMEFRTSNYLDSCASISLRTLATPNGINHAITAYEELRDSFAWGLGALEKRITY